MKQIISSRLAIFICCAAISVLCTLFILNLGFIYQSFYHLTGEIQNSLTSAGDYAMYLPHH